MTSEPFVAVIDYGIGNLRSAEKALVRAGADARLVTGAADVRAAAGVVLPGVGHFGRCSEALASSGMWEAAAEAASGTKPFLGICVGMQLLYESSEEAPEARGLGIFAGKVALLLGEVRRPQMQWNLLSVRPGSRLFAGLERGTWAYFVHSYSAPVGDETVATCDYGGVVAAAVESRNVFGAQFHPEKSSGAGLAVLANFVRIVTGQASKGPDLKTQALKTQALKTQALKTQALKTQALETQTWKTQTWKTQP